MNLINHHLALNVKCEGDTESAQKFLIENIPVFRNGYKSTCSKPTITTINTCAFDSIFSIFTCIYFDDPNFREYTELFVGRSDFRELIKKYFDTFNSKSKSKNSLKSSGELYDYRNQILNEIFSASNYRKSGNVIKNKSHMFIDCTTGIGGLFGQICMETSENIASSIEIKICHQCGVTNGKILPFLAIDVDDIDFENIQKSISFDRSKDKFCRHCKLECVIDKLYNNTLVLEVEPNKDIQSQNPISIQKLTESITVEKEYQLFGVIEFNPTITHFVAHVKRRGNAWTTYDDMKTVETETDITKDILPYLLFYKICTANNAFMSTLLSFFQNGKLQKPMMRKVNTKK